MSMWNNVKKTYDYLRSNGALATWYTVMERLSSRKDEPYCYDEVPEETLQLQRTRKWHKAYKISIVVPAYETKEEYLCRMIMSVLEQTYTDWELIIADASKTEVVSEVVKGYKEPRIHHLRLEHNGGISENSNRALEAVSGDYVGLLDHDDVLTPDCLYEVMNCLEQAEQEGRQLIFLYSDEDKTDEKLETFFEPHKKTKFNLDLIFSNNYICHFAVLQADYIKTLGFRKEYDGAQDYDLFLRIISRLLKEQKTDAIMHIPKVLYHWRCHTGSTAANPRSKYYAYEAGRRAVQDFADQNGIQAEVSHMDHLGFYRMNYENSLFAARKEVGAVGGKLVKGNKITGGIYTESGSIPYQGIHKNFSGYMHRLVLQQNVYALDIRTIQVRDELAEILSSVLVKYEEETKSIKLNQNLTKKEQKNALEEITRKSSMELSAQIREKGFLLVYDPQITWERFR